MIGKEAMRGEMMLKKMTEKRMNLEAGQRTLKEVAGIMRGRIAC